MGETLVVGAGGALGTLLVERLHVRGLDVRFTPDDRALAGELADAEAVINVTGPRVRPGLTWADYHREHVALTTQVARSMRAGARLVHVGSTAVFGARGDKLGHTSYEAPTRFPSAPYACAKLAAEAMARAVGHARGLQVIVLRPSMVYGPGVDSALATLSRLAERGVRLRLRPGHLRQHLLHVDLFVHAIERALVQSGPMDEPLLVADPFVLTNDDLAPRGGGGLPISFDVRWAAAAHERLGRHLRLSLSKLEALAVLALDNELDVDRTWQELGIDPRAFSRDTTFDAYWCGQA